MKIGFNIQSADPYFSGVETYSLGLLKALLEIDQENQYLVFTNCSKMIKKHLGNRNNCIIRDCDFLTNRLYRILWEHLILPLLTRKEKLDILHCPHYICPVIRLFRKSTAYIITLHDTIALDNPKWCKRSNAAYYRIVMPMAVKTASRIIAVSRYTAEKACHHFSHNSSKVRIIHPGIDITRFNMCRDTEQENRIRSRYHLPEKYILYAGNIEPKKNLLNLLKAMVTLNNKGLKYSLVITGQRSWKSQNVFNYIQAQFDPEEVNLTGYVDRNDMSGIIKMADCMLLPSFCEGFGFPAIEAFACGVPVAASCTGALQEINKKAYMCLDPQNPEQMAISIHQLLMDTKIREEQIKIALSEVQQFSWSDCAAKTLELYREIVQINA